jgi:Fe-Mn family superoxide dismutase
MAYTANNDAQLTGMEGFGEMRLNNHFTLNQGYVGNSYKMLEILELLLTEGKTATPEFEELKRQIGWEFNSMGLYEYYFDTLGGEREGRSQQPAGPEED